MDILEFLKDSSWDAPFFKRLANNDTGNASGHQGGMVILVGMRKYFPELEGSTTPEDPTVDRRIKARLFVGDHEIGNASPRYQFQTWKAKRTPESRLTDDWIKLRNKAEGGDLLVFQRSISDLDEYRMILLKKGTTEFKRLESKIKGRKSGTIGGVEPVTQNLLNSVKKIQDEREISSFVMFEDGEKRTSKTQKIVRSYVFREKVKQAYDYTCCLCGSSLESSLGMFEVEAAHIIPKANKGTDDTRNGLALCRSHHWAFDKGLFAVSDERKVVVPAAVSYRVRNGTIVEFDGSTIRSACDPKLDANIDALRWHRKNIAGIKP